MSPTKILDAIIAYSFYSLFFLVPLFLTPVNFELFEFNKMLLTYVFTIIITASWLLKSILLCRIKIARTPLDIPLVLFLGSQIISTIFSIHPHTSVWGYYSRFHGGLVSTICYLLLYYGLVSNLDKKKIINIVYFLLLSGFLVASYGILEHFGIDKEYWVQDVQNRVFSTLGQPNWLAAWLIALAPLTWSFVLSSKLKAQSSKPQRKTQNLLNFKLLKLKHLYLFLYLLFYICLLYTKSRSGLIGFLAAFLVFFILLPLSHSRSGKNRKAKHFSKLDMRPHIKFTKIILGSTFIISLLIGTEFTPSLEKIVRQFFKKSVVYEIDAKTPSPIYAPKISKSSDIRKIVWQGALAIWLDNPKTILIGDGCETFAYSYYNHRPKTHNVFSEWDFLYNKAHNEYLNFLANSGILGLGSYLSVIGVFIIWNLKRIRKHELGITDYGLRVVGCGLLAGYSSILVTNFFGFSVVAVALLFFLYPAFSFVLAGLPKRYYQLSVTRDTRHATRYLLLPLILLVACYMLHVTCKIWLADYYFAQGKGLSDSGFALRATQPLKKAIQLNNKEANFHAELAESASLLATSLPEEPEEQNLEEVAIWYQLAFEETEMATQLNPVHLNILRSQAKVYVRLAQIDPTLLNKAYEVLNQAIKLAPTEAKIFYNQAIILNQLEKKEEAIKFFEQAVSLKPDYRQARFALSLLYKETNRIEEAKRQLKFILEKINPEDEAASETLKLLNS